MPYFENIIRKRTKRPQSAPSERGKGGVTQVLASYLEGGDDIIHKTNKICRRKGRSLAIRFLSHSIRNRFHAEGILLRGWLLLQESDLKGAQGDFEKIIKLGARWSVSATALSCANRGMACIWSEKGDFSRAEIYLARAQVTDVYKIPTLLCRGLIYLAFNKVFQIEQISSDLESIDSSIPHGLFLRAQARCNWGLKKQAIEDLRTCIKLCTVMQPVPGYLLVLARQEIIRILIKEENFREANECAKVLRVNLSKYCRDKDADDFVEYGRRTAMWEVPTLKDVLYFEHWTNACFNICRLSEAKEDNDKIHHGSDSHQDFQESLVQVIKSLQLAQKAKPGSPDILQWLGYTYGQMQKWDDSYFCFRKCLETGKVEDKITIQQVSYGMEVARASLAAKEGRNRQAIEYFILAEKVQTELKGQSKTTLLAAVPLWRKALVQILCAQNIAGKDERVKMLKSTVCDLQQVIQRLHRHPKIMQARAYLAVAYRLLGKPEDAIFCLDTALYMMQETLKVSPQQDDGILRWRSRLLPLAQTLWTERACCFLMMGELEHAVDTLKVCQDSADGENGDGLYQILQSRLKLIIGQPKEALHCSTESLWEARHALKDPYLRAWVNTQHIVCLLSNGMFKKAEIFCDKALSDADSISNKYPEMLALVDLRGILHVVNGNPDLALADWQMLVRNQSRHIMAASDSTILRQIVEVFECNTTNINNRRCLQLSQKLSMAIQLAVRKKTPRRNNMVGLRNWRLFNLFYLYLYRGVYNYYGGALEEATQDFESSLSQLMQNKIRTDRLTTAMMAVFLYYNGAVTYLRLKRSTESIAWFELALEAIDKSIDLSDKMGLNDGERKVLRNRKKVISLFYGLASLANGNSRKGRAVLKQFGGKKVFSKLQVGKSKSHGSIPHVDLLEGRINSVRKSNSWKTLASGKRKMSFWNTQYSNIKIGAVSLCTRLIGFWPVMPECNSLVPSLQRFCIVSLRIENIDDCNDTVACPSTRIKNANFEAAVEYENTLIENSQHEEVLDVEDSDTSMGSEYANINQQDPTTRYDDASPGQNHVHEPTRSPHHDVPPNGKENIEASPEYQSSEDEFAEEMIPQSFRSVEKLSCAAEQVEEEIFPTWESLGFDGVFEDHFDIFAGGVPSNSTSSGSSNSSSEEFAADHTSN